ncbi:MAG: Cof-type HAD-IIB family hydrolase [Tannerella sp.]|jgi:Cof subfamily protein (haloacid dehalogenase superfamily)|nr:Cof-type HAD-IIB family hydrolase [Tannerella sp.]
MVRGIFLDIDGTMVSFKTHRMPDNTKEALMEARRRGVKVFVATGRHFSDINNLDNLEFDGYITLNGAYCTADGKVLFKKSIPRNNVEAFIHYDTTVERVPCFFVDADSVTANGVFDITERMMKLVEFPPRPVLDSTAFLDREIFQLTAFFSTEKEPEIMRFLPDCQATRWYPTFADIVAKGIDKSVGIQEVIRRFGLSREEIMTFGDGGNDITMLRYAGIGVAMGNAEEEVKQSADYITTSVDDDGVGEALRRFGVI